MFSGESTETIFPVIVTCWFTERSGSLAIMISVESDIAGSTLNLFADFATFDRLFSNISISVALSLHSFI